MKKCLALVGLGLLLVAQAAVAQTSTDTTSTQSTPAPTPAPAPAPTPAPTPAPAPAAQSAPRPTSYRYGTLSGGWLRPTGDFDKVAGNGWNIVVEGYQFLNPSRKLAAGSQIGYYSFAEKNGVTVSNFPIDLVLKFFPKPDTGKMSLYGTGGLGFNYLRTEVNRSTSSDYEFGTQAGVGVQLHGSGPAALMAEAAYHWIYSSGTDADFLALRAGILVPIVR